MLSATLAQQIAGETTEAIGYNVIITDADGTVIGSGDARRVGTFHEASVEVMRTQQSAWHTPEQARGLRGVRPGITLPLVVAGEAVGTVGITGTPRQVRRFGLLVRRQTEILLEESALLQSRLLHEKALEDLVDQVTSYDPEVLDSELLVAGARQLGFTLLQPRVVVVLELTETRIGPELLRTVRGVFRQREDIVASHDANRCTVLASMRARTMPRLAADVERAVELVEQRFEVAARAGIGSRASTLEGMRDSSQDAADALWLGARVEPGHAVTRIGDMRVTQALAAVPHRRRERLVDTSLGPLVESGGWPQLRETIVAWCESGFNLVAASTALHIHRNTLVYRLERIERLLEQPWRDHRAMLTLYVACLADQVTPRSG
jgi:carbohydrate diacid regulator